MNAIPLGYFKCGDTILIRFENRVMGRAGTMLLPPALAALALVAPGFTAPALASGPLDPAAIVATPMPAAAPASVAQAPAVAPSSGSMTVEAAGVSVTVSGADASSTPTVTVSGSPSAALPNAGPAAGEQGKAPPATLTAAAPQYHEAVTQYQAAVTVHPAAAIAPTTDVSVSVSGNDASPHRTAPRAADPTTQAPGAAAAGSARTPAAHGDTCDTTSVDTAISIAGDLSGPIRQEVSALICVKIPNVSVQMPGHIGSSSSTPVPADPQPGTCMVRAGAAVPDCAPVDGNVARARARPVLSPAAPTTACCIQSASPAGAAQSATAAHVEPRAAPSSDSRARVPDRSERGPPGPGRLPPLPLPAPAGMAAGGVGGGGVFGPVFMALMLWLLLQPPGISVLRLPAQIRSPKALVDDRRDRPG